VVSVKVPAVVESLERVNELVNRLAARAGLARRETYQLRLATEELFINIVKHGYGTIRPPGEVVIEGGSSDGRAWVTLIDTAAPFDPFAAPAPTGLDRPLQDRAPGALGLYLARHAVDEASHEYVDGTNRTTVVVRARANGDGRTYDSRDRPDRQRV
jgi:anti-sigma regulatory factor (Ser/Thr protein kinase)